MYISQSDVAMSAEHTLNESLSTTRKEKRESGVLFGKHLEAVAVETAEMEDALDVQDAKTRLFNVLYAAITGQKLLLGSSQGDWAADSLAKGLCEQSNWSEGRVQHSAATQGLGQMKWETLEVSVSQRYERSETSNFSLAGTVQTADGRVLDLNMSLSMESHLTYQSDSYIKQSVIFKDPLVLNFDGAMAELSDQKFEFDIDDDGVLDLMPFLESGSGWLAMDHNQDGKINDGSELFGAISNNGFDDLLKYDDDKNGFIDEADAAFETLQIWGKSVEGEALTSLSANNIGAIALGSMETPFMMYHNSGEVAAAVRETGYFLKESGGVGVMQQVDIATVEDEEQLS